ncbi:MAG: glycerol-3-phosphate 1-O-acyltransferase PlsY [Actinobacteria bacterium]|nr:glycerol-3-phosphate 1-O-acyltransferase PlsY [Actinomycetota bacterium]
MSTTLLLEAIGLVILGYVIGSFSPSVFLGRWCRGTDVRCHGSGNAGTTNAFRVLGPKLGLFVLFVDILKGVAPVVLARELSTPLVTVFVALACVLGHNYSVFLRGRGGKGVATGAGAAIGMMPIPMAILVGVYLTLLFGTRFVSVASITCTILLPIFGVVFDQPLPYVVVFCLMSAVVLWAHRGNFVRLWRRKEPRISFPWRDRNAARPPCGDALASGRSHEDGQG